MKAAFGPHGYLLTAAVSAGKPTIDKAYDIPELSNFLDFINVMAYDFHGAWEHVTGHNAPLYPKASDSQQDRDFTVEYSIDYYINNGADPKKLVSYSVIIPTLKIYSPFCILFALEKFQMIGNSLL